MINKIQNLTWLLVLELVNLSCHKEYYHPDPCHGHSGETVVLSSDLLNFKFKTGTYWFFVDSINGLNDSSFVISGNDDNWKDLCGNYRQSFAFSLITHPSLDTINYQLDGNTMSMGGYYGKVIYNRFNIEKSYDSLFIYNKYYKNVTVTTSYGYPFGNQDSVVYYMNADFGFLRTDVFNPNDSLIYKKLLTKVNIIR